MIAINKLREVVRLILLFGHYSDNYIERLTHCTHQTIGRIRWKLEDIEVGWTRVESFDDDELRTLLYPRLQHRCSKKIEPDYPAIYKEAIKKGKHKKTLSVLYLDYWKKYGDKAYRESRFYQLVSAYLKSHSVFMKQRYLPGEVLFIDYAGTRLTYTVQGKTKYLYVFVSCMGFSKQLFAFATTDMTSNSWILGLSKALEYYGGVPEVIQFDNAKAMVTKAALIAILNDNAQLFSQHYGCICDTSRVATPTDNANAEAAVKFISQRILELMNRDFSFFNQAEVNSHLLHEIDKLNQLNFQKLEVSRNDLFESKEKAALSSLPMKAYKPFIQQKIIKVPTTYLIPYKGHEYSVPYTLVNEQVMIRVTETAFLAFHKHALIAQHKLSHEAFGFTRLTEHMKPSHLAQERKSKETFISWAHDISEDVERFIEKQYSFTRNTQSRAVGKRCLALQKLCDKCGEEIFSKACHYAFEHGWYEPREVSLVISAKAFQSDDKPNLLKHKNIRGKDYFEENSHD